jgi:dihydrofolate reductase
VVAVEFMSLDGVMEDPQWTGGFWHDDIAQYQHDQLFRSDALLLGRVTYEDMAEAWPTMEDTGDFGERMNSLPKHVATATKTDLKWNATPIKGDLAAAVAELKDQEGEDLLIYGSGQLVRSLMSDNLIDEYCLLTFPIVLGKGQRLFDNATDAPALKLADTKVFPSGALALVYQPVG